MRDITGKPSLYSINTATLGYQTSLPEIIDDCARRGIGGIAPWRKELSGHSLPDIARQLRSNNMSVSGLCRSTCYTAPTREERQLAIDENRRTLDVAAELSASCYMQVVGGLPVGSKNLPEARRQVIEGIRQLLPHSREVGVPIALEPLHPMTTADRSCLTSLKQALDWCDELDPDGEFGLGVAVDVYHLWWDPELFSQIARAGKRILAFHVSDWLVPTVDLVNDRGMPGDGVIDIRSIREQVEKAGFNGLVELEIFSTGNWWKQKQDYILDVSIERISEYC
ncbi:sugar phosphate isomerase/epimerase [Salmonella enterica]|uniref:Sugar phosphate isomerase/epimerase n=1 Tax=Salmonella enterica TaxID=28901 RepID=A0A3V7Z1H6_SALER|nr:sugar phosphate isomerase/epimerase [Salmonella enterica]EAZ3130419.1 sugar phosphate isomerase/epimerase [Salmonella enterica]MMS79142.1 sugar phosphate isomerase/epimerase [Salmonella enterica]HAF4830577.1 sugar phosphate isomerase/epimerase [Salmonella enterica]HAV0157157.1 sugar phosphate isomerase/epimerase [Salmonella enterica]